MIFFNSKKISDSVTRIYGITGELMYLVEGSKSAALIDTGCGAGSLKSYVESLTKKPYVILLTHGHVDHAMGAPEFTVPIYMNQADDVVCNESSGMDVRKGYLEMSGKLELVKEEDFISARKGEYLPFNQGDIFDLGGITLEAYECMGHTPGSMVLLLKEERTLLLGDACNTFTFLFDHQSAGLTTYLKQLMHLQDQLGGAFDRVYLSHGDGESPKEILANVIQVCNEVLSGISDEIPFQFMDQEALIAKEMDFTTMQRRDGGIGNVIYSKEKLKQ